MASWSLSLMYCTDVRQTTRTAAPEMGADVCQCRRCEWSVYWPFAAVCFGIAGTSSTRWRLIGWHLHFLHPEVELRIDGGRLRREASLLLHGAEAIAATRAPIPRVHQLKPDRGLVAAFGRSPGRDGNCAAGHGESLKSMLASRGSRCRPHVDFESRVS